MAETKKSTTKKSGTTRSGNPNFEAPLIGKRYPKGTTVKRNKDGTITLVPPKAKK